MKRKGGVARSQGKGSRMQRESTLNVCDWHEMIYIPRSIRPYFMKRRVISILNRGVAAYEKKHASGHAAGRGRMD